MTCCCDYRFEWARQPEPGGTWLYICHQRDDFGEGTGNVSRLNPSDGSVIWTYDAGATHAGTGFNKVMTRCSIDSAGNAYATWYLDNTGDGLGDHTGSRSNPSAGVLKLNEDGAFQWEVEFGQTKLPPNGYGTAYWVYNNFIKVDPNDDDRIYVTTKVESDGMWIYRLDADGNVTATYSLNAGGSDLIRGNGAMLEIDADGNIYSVNDLAFGDSFYAVKFQPDGTELVRYTSQPVQTGPGVSDSSGRIVVGSGPMSAASDVIMQMMDDSGTVWSARFNSFAAAGWAFNGGHVTGVGARPNGYLAVSLSAQNLNGIDGVKPYNIFSTNEAGTVSYMAHVGIPRIFDLASSANSLAAYVCGMVQAGSGFFNVARLESENGNTTWTQSYGSGAQRYIRGIAVR